MARERIYADGNDSEANDKFRMQGEAIADLELICDFPQQFSWSAYCSAPSYFPGGFSVVNRSENAIYEDLTIRVVATPSYIVDKVWHIAKIHPGHRLSLSGRDFTFNEALLGQLSDAPLQATLSYNMTWQTNQGEQIISQGAQTITLLASNNWNGAANMGELLPIFVRPQEATVSRIVGDAMLRIHENKTQDYRTLTPGKLKETVGALYDVLNELSLNFDSKQQDFQFDSFCIASPQEVMRGHKVTSLDVALFVASMLEHMELHPLIILYRQRALVGVWTKGNLILDSLTMTRPEILRYQHQQKNLLVLDPRCIAHRPLINYSQMLQSGALAIEGSCDADFIGAYDIRLGRTCKIIPIDADRNSSGAMAPFNQQNPLVQAKQVESEATLALGRAMPDLLKLTSGRSLTDTIPVGVIVTPSENGDDSPVTVANSFATPLERLRYNRTRLLNLTPANPLLNLQDSNSAITTVLATSSSLLRHLNRNTEFRPIALEMWGTTPESKDFPPLEAPFNNLTVEATLTNGHIFIDSSEEDLNESLRRLYHIEDNERQQQGVGTLHMAFLFVNWRRQLATYKAPLFLMPLALKKAENHRDWTIRPVSSDLWLNSNLIELLRQVYTLDVSTLRPQLGNCAREGDLERAKQLLDEAFKDIPGLDWSDELAIGSFPMSRFQIWRDLERLTPALSTPRIQEILDPVPDLNRTEVRSAGIIDGMTLEAKYPPESTLLPWSCDASQLEAIVYANGGQDMVLIAPPGTGKNRTIANLICHRLSLGQKVLLVTKHRTTLRVVQRMLKKVGLGDFSLYLPSPRSADDFMLDQLRAAWQAKSPSIPRETLKSEPYLAIHRRLTDTYLCLHQRRRNGLTLHEAITRAMQEQEKRMPEPAFSLSWPSYDTHNEVALREMRRLVENLASQKSKFSGPTSQILRKIDHTEWSAEWQNDMRETLTRLRDLNDGLDRCLERFWQHIGCDINVHTGYTREMSFELSKLLLSCAGSPVAFALESDAAQRLDMLVRLAMHANAYAQAEAQLSCTYKAQAWQNLAGHKINERWRKALRTWWPKSAMLKKQIIREVKNGGALQEPDISNDAPLFDRMCSEAQEMLEINNAMRIPGVWNGFETPAQRMIDLEQLGSRLRNFVANLSDIPELMVTLKAQLHTLFSEHADWFEADGCIGKQAQECLNIWKALQIQSTTLQRLSGITIESGIRHSDDISDELRSLCTSLLDQSTQWRSWCEWCQSRKRANEIGLAPLLQAIDSGKVTSGQAESQFMRAYYSWWLKAVMAQDEQIQGFSPSEMSELLEQFRASEPSWRQAISKIIAGTISSNIPDFDGDYPNEAWKLLREEFDKQSDHKSATRLWTEMPEAITTLTPCLMMSPATVSQFLSSHMEPFDLVILAEASQLTVEEGLCSCARAKQVVAVGDPKQMPPLFDNCSGIEGSILDKFIKNGATMRGLQQHYHSKEESLIAYANHRYYNNSICTFPAPLHGVRDLKMALIEGPYNRLTKTNLNEAQAVVREIVYRLTNEDPAIRNRSIGVLTLSVAQQQLIEDMLAEEVSANPEIAWAFDEEQCPTPVIVRYLENSQGEYRDVVFMCLTYGWDSEGHFTLDFGPLNKTHGGSLLNVAITRSREEMVVCANFHASDIDISRTQTPAIADLKEFLTFVETGYNAESLAYKMEFPQDPLMDQVAAGLRAKGWQVHRQVGLSPLRISLAVVNPDDSDHYLTCVLGDSYLYRELHLTSERDLVRPKQLQRLGWNIQRVWSIDWWKHPEATLERLHQSIIKLLRIERAKPRY